MQDLTTGSLSGHLLKTTSYMLVSMAFQTLYVLIDLYWVGRLGTDAVAAVAHRFHDPDGRRYRVVAGGHPAPAPEEASVTERVFERGHR